LIYIVVVFFFALGIPCEGLARDGAPFWRLGFPLSLLGAIGTLRMSWGSAQLLQYSAISSALRESGIGVVGWLSFATQQAT
jgi:hypothetical protein